MENDLQKYLPLSEQVYFILISLAKSPKHGYAVAKDVRVLSDERTSLSVSTLYTLLKRLLEDGWIQRSDDDNAQEENGRSRKIYELTDLGRQILVLDVARLKKLIFVAEFQQAEGKV